jgi:hypothetical protein
MRSTLSIILIVLTQPSFQIDTTLRGWRGIVPLHSTRTDVERLLGAGINKDFVSRYYLKNENVLFHYSTGDCKSGKGAWDVPIDTVIWITISPKPNPQLSDLKIDEEMFQKSQRGHIRDEEYYENEEGLQLTVYEGRVHTFLYGPAAKEKSLRCSK